MSRRNGIASTTHGGRRGSRRKGNMETPVTPLGVQRIENRIETIIQHIDMDDHRNRPKQFRQTGLSRALAAYCIKIIGHTDDVTAAKSVTDQFHDRGIDAIYFDPTSSQLLIVQSKWSSGINWVEAGEFMDGVRKIVTAQWSAFTTNEKIYPRRNEIHTALMSGSRVVLITVHIGPDPTAEGVLGRIDGLAEEISGGSDLAASIHWHQPHLLDAITTESDPPKVNADLYLSNWGEINEPYRAVFGRIQGNQLAELWKANPHLAHLNIRDYSRRSDVNLAIANTAVTEPSNFWYFNNGITIVCDSIVPGLLGRLDPKIALFKFKGISIVNGAQTTGILSDNIDKIPDSERANLWVQIRAIALGDCPKEFEKRVTKFTNLQNAISIQDWVSLDPVQSRLAIDFAIANRSYAFRWGGDSDPTGERGCTLKEATIALACAQPDPWYAVQAKREISVLWDTDSDRYKQLFHAELSAKRVWNAVVVLREAEDTIGRLGSNGSVKADLVASHLQRLILHIVFQAPGLANWESAVDYPKLIAAVVNAAATAFENVRGYLILHHAGEYTASLAKNFDKCRKLTEGVLAMQRSDPAPAPVQVSIVEQPIVRAQATEAVKKPPSLPFPEDGK